MTAPIESTPSREAVPAREVPDAKRLRAYLGEPERAPLFQALQATLPGVALWQTLEAWALIVGSWALCFYVSPLWLPVALVLIGSRQRALGNKLHDASHGNTFVTARANRVGGALLYALPMFEDFELYRVQHMKHHAYLGQPENDPDYLEVPASCRGGPGASWRMFLHFALQPGLWRDSVLGTLHRQTWRQRLNALAWWVGALGLLGLLASPTAAASFFGLWMLARATSYHVIKIFAEVSDHIGLEPGSVLRYTRNLPNTALSFFLHPHHDNWHLAHHLFPRIPQAQLGRLHTLLMEVPLYAQGHHCTAYFSGEASVVRSWIQARPLPEQPKGGLEFH
ncbi:MAG: fatty acid desaturase [Myxococcaceae bacterium]|nr:fatty acid desaturase [Myxococcaceae bacterium]